MNAAAFLGFLCEDNGRCAMTEIRQLPPDGNVSVCVWDVDDMVRLLTFYLMGGHLVFCSY